MIDSLKDSKIVESAKDSKITEPILYKRKGIGKIVGFIIVILFFYLTPIVGRKLWPKKLHENLRLFNYLTVMITHQSIFLFWNLIYYFIYTLEIPFFERYRIHNEEWPWKKNKEEWYILLKETLFYLFINQFVVSTLAGLIIFIRKTPIIKLEYENLPKSFELFWQIIFLILCEDFLFYWSHRILHIKQIYPYIHKIHHKYTNVIGIASENAHPIEFLFGNALPTSAGVIILGSKIHLFTNLLWIILRIIKTTEAHSGYDFSWSPFSLFPFFSSSDFHNFHHLKYKGNYGSFLTIWDTVCDTINKDYKLFRDKKNYLEKKNK